MSEKDWDLIIVGGGAAGFFSALSVAEHAEEPLRILILEKTGQLLGKVRISGGGRCNVTHDCLDPKRLSTHYPRGEKSLIGSFHRFGPEETVAWFTEKGVDLKVEDDGRMFPVSDSSTTIINCLKETAEDYGIEVRVKTGVEEITQAPHGFTLKTSEGTLNTRKVLLATGGTRLTAGARLAEGLGHHLHAPVPSLFTFNIEHPLLSDLEGVSVNPVSIKINGTRYKNTGPLLITHWGVSGPGVLKLSALAARDLADCDYTFTLEVDWCPNGDPARILNLKRQEWGKRALTTRSPLASLPKRLWVRFVELAEIPAETTWSQLSKKHLVALCALLHRTELPVTGKSMNKEEFVTCGGVDLKEVNLKTMESKLVPDLYFAGEVLNIDGVTGGFNFQNAWTGGYHAGVAIAEGV